MLELNKIHTHYLQDGERRNVLVTIHMAEV